MAVHFLDGELSFFSPATSDSSQEILPSSNSFTPRKPYYIPLQALPSSKLTPDASLNLSVIIHAAHTSEHDLSLLLVFRDVSDFSHHEYLLNCRSLKVKPFDLHVSRVDTRSEGFWTSRLHMSRASLFRIHSWSIWSWRTPRRLVVYMSHRSRQSVRRGHVCLSQTTPRKQHILLCFYIHALISHEVSLWHRARSRGSRLPHNPCKLRLK